MIRPGGVLAIAALAAACGSSGDGDKAAGPPCAERAGCVVALGDIELTLRSWRFLMLSAPGGGEARAASTMDILISRALLLEQAQRDGITVTPEQVQRDLSEGRLRIGGSAVDGTDLYFDDGFFSQRRLRAFADRLGLSGINDLVAEQQLEQTAARARERIPAAELDGWLAARCTEALSTGRLTINDAVLASADDAGRPKPSTYKPCSR